MFTERDRHTLVTWARDSIRAGLGAPTPLPPRLDAGNPDAATFVTLEWPDGDLQGCIGNLEPSQPLLDAIASNACSAAFRDPRNRDLFAEDVDRLGIEISVLSPLEPIEVRDEAATAAGLRPGIDGLVLQWRQHKGTFLPQVWEHFDDPLVFLRQLKRKARLPTDFWSNELELWRYSVERWSEPGGLS